MTFTVDLPQMPELWSPEWWLYAIGLWYALAAVFIRILSLFKDLSGYPKGAKSSAVDRAVGTFFTWALSPVFAFGFAVAIVVLGFGWIMSWTPEKRKDQ